MTMVIECEACQSRFRLDEALFKGARAIRVRCRKCGGPIVALNPDIPEWMYTEEKAPARRSEPIRSAREEQPAAPEAPEKETMPAPEGTAAAGPAASEPDEEPEAAPEAAPLESPPAPGKAADDDASPPLDVGSDAAPAGEAVREESEEPPEPLRSEPAPPQEAEAGIPWAPAPPEASPPFWLEEEPLLQFDRSAEVPAAGAASEPAPPEALPPLRLDEESPLQFDEPADVRIESGDLATPDEAPLQSSLPVDETPREAAESAFEGWLDGRWVTLEVTPLPPWVEEEPPEELLGPPGAGRMGIGGPAAAEKPLAPAAGGPERADAGPSEQPVDEAARAEKFSANLDDLLSHMPEDSPKRSGPAPPEPPGADAPPLSEPREPDRSERYPSAPEGPENFVRAIEDLFAPAPPGDSKPRTASFEGGRPDRFAAPPRAPKRAAERPPYMRPLFLAGVAVWLLLLAGGALFFGTGGTPGRSLPASAGGSGTASAGAGVYEIRDVRWKTVRKTDAGDLFVVRGTVVNAGAEDSGGIRIQATLLDKDNKALGERDVFAGNVIDDTTLSHASQTVLKGVLNKRFGDGERNKDIRPGGSLPFMVVFFDPPAEIGSILVKGVDAP